MTYSLTQSDLRVAVGRNIGEPEPLGQFTNSPGLTNLAIDINRFDDTNTFNGGYIQDTSAVGYPTARINTWDLPTNTFNLYRALQPTSIVLPTIGDIYEVHQKLSFPQFRNCINNGIGWCGKWLRNQVRDETQTLIANQYTYKPNYSASATNAFWPGEVVRVDWEYWLGQQTKTWMELQGWFYLDDETIQFPTWVVDQWAPNPIRFTGYGPVSGFITDDNPARVIGTFDDDFAANMLIWATTAAAWNTLGAQLEANEQSAAKANEQNALQQAQASRSTWERGRAQTGRVRTPVSIGGWQGN